MFLLLNLACPMGSEMELRFTLKKEDAIIFSKTFAHLKIAMVLQK